MILVSGNPYSRGKLSTAHLLVLTSFDQSLFILKILFTFYKTSYLNEGVNRTELSPSFSVFCQHTQGLSSKHNHKHITILYQESNFTNKNNNKPSLMKIQ